jgi:hypothetical protein
MKLKAGFRFLESRKLLRRAVLAFATMSAIVGILVWRSAQSELGRMSDLEFMALARMQTIASEEIETFAKSAKFKSLEDIYAGNLKFPEGYHYKISFGVGKEFKLWGTPERYNDRPKLSLFHRHSALRRISFFLDENLVIYGSDNAGDLYSESGRPYSEFSSECACWVLLDATFVER